MVRLNSDYFFSIRRCKIPLRLPSKKKEIRNHSLWTTTTLKITTILLYNHLKIPIHLKIILGALFCSWVSEFFTLLLGRVVLPLYANGERKSCNEKKKNTTKKKLFKLYFHIKVWWKCGIWTSKSAFACKERKYTKKGIFDVLENYFICLFLTTFFFLTTLHFA
jgi:hypothetical protein